MTRAVRRLALLTLAVAGAVGAAPSAHAEPASEPLRGWMTDASVKAIAPSADGDRLFLGGSFSFVGRRAVGGAVVDLAEGAADLRWPDSGPASTDGALSQVNAAIPDRQGGWYVGGTFDTYGGRPRSRLVHLKADRTVDLGFDAKLGGRGAPVNALALSPDGTRLYVGGEFPSVAGRAGHARLVALDAATGAPAWRPGATTPLVQQSVSALAVSDHGTLYVAGAFQAVAGAPRPGLAEVGLDDGAPTAWAPDASGTAIGDVEPVGDRVYVAGAFGAIGGAARTSVAALSAADGGVLPWDARVSGGSVADVEPVSDGVVLGGDFTRIGSGAGVARDGLAEVAASDGAARPWKPALAQTGWTPAIGSVREHDGTIYVVGRFDRAGGAPRRGAAAFAVGEAAPTGWDPSLGDSALTSLITEGVLAIAGDEAFVGGLMSAVDVRRRRGLAAIDVAADRLLALGAGTALDAGGEVRALALADDGATLYAGGSFAEVSGTPRAGLAAFATAGDGSAPTPWDPGAVGYATSAGREAVEVNALAVRDGAVVVGGRFEGLGAVRGGSTPVRRALGAVDAATGAATAFRADATGAGRTVHALALSPDGETLYVGGSFDEVGGSPRTAIAAVDGATGAVRPWNPGPRTASASQVLALATHGSVVYAAGDFPAMGAQAPQPARANLAALDAQSGAATSFAPNPNAPVRALAVDADGVVYLGGAEPLTEVAGAPRRFLAAVRPDGSLSPWNPNGTSGYTQPLVLAAPADGLVAGATEGDFVAGGLQAGSLPRFGPGKTAPRGVTVPDVTGAPKVGETLTCGDGVWDGTQPITFARAWLRDGQPVAGAELPRYVVGPADVEHELVCRVTATNDVGSAHADSAPVRVAGEAPRNFEPPAVVGDPYPGETVSCTTGIWANYPEVDGYRYRWLRDGAPVAGGDGAELRLGEADVDHAFACEVAAFNAVGAAPAVRSQAVRVTVRPPAPSPPGPPAPPAPQPPAPGPSGPATPGPQPPAGDGKDDRDAAPAVPRLAGGAAVRADARGRVALRLSCPKGGAACAGRLTLTAKLRVKGRTRTVTAGRATIRIAAGRTATVRVTLSAQARSALRRSGRLALTATTEAGGRTSATRLSVRAAAGGRR